MELTAIFINFGQGLAYAVITFIFIIIAKKIADWRTSKFDDDKEIIEKSNNAVGFRRTGLYVAYAIAFAGTLGADGGADFKRDVLALLVDGVLITVCLFACRAINDRIMLPNINNDDEAEKGNVAVGLAECGMYIGTGFVLNGAFAGGGESLQVGVVGALVFFVIGQIALLLCGRCYEMITPYNVREEIEKGNAAAGVALAGMLIALGIILRSSIAGPSMGWTADLASFGLYTVYGIVLLLIFRKAIDIFLLPNTSMADEVARDRNVAALALTQAGIIAVAIVISSLM
ncbi:MAG: DUF350 domain-containing protein [Desulfobacterales bacterium]|nr:DUF350 domain-containing protein [Desulfobacterales bacterium]